MNCLYIWLWLYIRHLLKKTDWNAPLPYARARAHGKGAIFCRVWGQGTRQRCNCLPCARARHTANSLCLPCAKPLQHTANSLFNGVPSSPLYFAVGLKKHMAKCLPCARNVAHGKQPLCRPLYVVRCLPCVTLGKHFAVVLCFWKLSKKIVASFCLWNSTILRSIIPRDHALNLVELLSRRYICMIVTYDQPILYRFAHINMVAY